MGLVNDISNLNAFQMVVFGSVLTGVFYFSLYNDGSALKRQTEEVRSQIQTAEKDLEKKQEELDRLIQFERDLEVDEKSIGIFLEYIPEEMTTVDMFRFITKEAKLSGVNIEDKRDNGMKEEELFSSLKISLRVSGSFPQIVFFLSRLTAQERILLVDTIQVESFQSNRLVKASMNIYAFRYKGIPAEEEKEEGS